MRRRYEEAGWPTIQPARGVLATGSYAPSKHEVETFSGVYVDTESPRPETIRLQDIAHSLSNLCRFGGHCRRFYSVAEHAVMVSRRIESLIESRELCLAGLHHDDAEAFLGDIPRPLKLHLGRRYALLSKRMDAAVCAGLQLGLDAGAFHTPMVKEADNWALLIEAHHLLPSKGINWEGSAVDWGLDTVPDSFESDYWTGGLDPAEAEALFLSRHHELT